MTILYKPKQMLPAMKKIVQPDTFLHNLLVTGTRTTDKTYIELDKYVGKQGIAAYNSRTGAATSVGKKGFSTDLHVAPYINEFIEMTPSDFDDRMASENIYDTRPGSNIAVKTNDYLRELNNRCIRREEKQLAEGLQTGTLTVQNTAAGVDYEIDFGLDDDNKETLSSTENWDETTADILGNLEDWGFRLAKLGYPAVNVVMDVKATQFLRANAKVQAILDSRRIMAGEIDMRVVNGQRASYVGALNLAGINIDLWCYMGIYETAADTSSNMLDDYRVCMIGAGLEVEMNYAKIENFKAGFIGERFPNMWEENSGKVRYIGMESAPCAVFRNPNAIFSALVKS